MAKIQDLIGYAWKNLRTTKLRSYLTIIGIVIGVIAMVAVTSISEGVQRDINKELDAFGPNKMFIVPSAIKEGNLGSMGGIQGASSGKLFVRDAEIISGLANVKSLAMMSYGRTSVGFKGKAITATIYATESSFFDQWPDYLKLDSGRVFKAGERKVVVLGYKAAKETFGKDKISVGNVILINNQEYRVVGVFAEIGTAFGATDDSSIYVPFDDGETLFRSQLAKNEINFIAIEAFSDTNMADLKDVITNRLAALHKVRPDEPDFTVITADFINNTIGTLIQRLGIFLFFITMIATLVGGIGIMNTMFMGVLERVQEIGVLKAIGATERDILLIFMTESGILGFLGGFIGLVIGALIVVVAGSFGVPYWLRLRIIFFAFLFSAGVGIVAGFLPARQAAKMDPVDALRYE